MQFHFNIKRAIQASALLIRTEQKTCMNYMRLLKLLYIAERESIQDNCQPVIGGSVYAMPRGPVLQDVYDLIKETHAQAPEWSEHFERVDYEIRLKDNPGTDALSIYSVEKLQEIAARYATKDEWDMVNETHKFPEWIKNNPGASSKRIPLEDILVETGHRNEIGAILAEAQRSVAVARFFERRTPRRSAIQGAPV